jgi:hypothetical protein
VSWLGKRKEERSREEERREGGHRGMEIKNMFYLNMSTKCI